MADKTDWYCYTDESGKRWRIKTTAYLAEIGGLQPTDGSAYPPLPDLIKPRYVWLQELPRPKDRLAARQKVIIECDRLAELWEHDLMNDRPAFKFGDKELRCVSYYGETVFTK